MTGTPPRPAPGVRTPGQLRRELVKLHAWAGSPGARRLTTVAADLGLVLARSTTQDLISGARVGGLPNRDFVQAFVMACLRHSGSTAADAETETKPWEHAWLAVVQSHGQMPVTPGAERAASPRPAANGSPYRMIFIATSAVALLAAAAVPFLVTNSDDPPAAQSEPTVSTAGIQDVHCSPDGSAASWRNHHSQLYLAVRKSDPGSAVELRKHSGSGPGTTFIITRHRIPAIDGCVHRLNSGKLCVEASASGKTIVAECTEKPEQLWLIENHWHHEGVMWKRLRPAGWADLCLQQQDDEEGSRVRANLKPCGTNWIQQWQLRPADG